MDIDKVVINNFRSLNKCSVVGGNITAFVRANNS